MEGKNLSKAKNAVIIISALIIGGIEGYIPLLCWVFLLANVLVLTFNKTNIVLRKFVSWSLVGFFCGYLVSCGVIYNSVDKEMAKMEEKSKARQERINNFFRN